MDLVNAATFISASCGALGGVSGFPTVLQPAASTAVVPSNDRRVSIALLLSSKVQCLSCLGAFVLHIPRPTRRRVLNPSLHSGAVCQALKGETPPP